MFDPFFHLLITSEIPETFSMCSNCSLSYSCRVRTMLYNSKFSTITNPLNSKLSGISKAFSNELGVSMTMCMGGMLLRLLLPVNAPNITPIWAFKLLCCTIKYFKVSSKLGWSKEFLRGDALQELLRDDVPRESDGEESLLCLVKLWVAKSLLECKPLFCNVSLLSGVPLLGVASLLLCISLPIGGNCFPWGFAKFLIVH